MNSSAFVYILLCRDNTLYTGWSNDLNRRIATHNAAKGAKYTRSRTPVRLVYFETCKDKIHAMQREYQIKQLPRAQKLRLIEKNRSCLLPAVRQ